MRLLAILTVLLVLVMPAAAAEPARLAGAVKTPLVLDEATLKSFPPATVELPAEGDKKSSFTGVLVWDLLQKAELVNDDAGRNAWLRHTLLVTADNGYAVSFAAAEFDPAYRKEQVLLAYQGDQAAFDHLRLIVPGDLRAGRSVRGLISIEVK